MTGTIIGMHNNKAIVQHNDSKPNRNILVVGGPGSYKTQSVVITNILNETENSIVVTDTKGEITESTLKIKQMQGYDTYVVNYDNMQASNRVNNLDYVEKDRDAQSVATTIVDSANKDGKKDVWYYSQLALLKALILYVKYEEHPSKRNLGGILDFLQEFDTEKDEETNESSLDRQFSLLDKKHPARRSYELGFKKSKGEMQGSIIVSLLTTLSTYVDEEVDHFTSFSDFHLQDIGKKKTIVYVIIPTMDSSWEGLTNLFFTQLFDELYKLASKHYAKLPINVNFMLDEFVNLGKFPNFEKFLATCRGYGIGVTTIIQSIPQLIDKYNENQAEAIIGNCATKILLNAPNKKTAEYIKSLLDKATVRVDTENETKQHGGDDSSKGSTSEGYNYIGRDLMTSQELTQMPDDQSIILVSNKHPIKAKKAFQFKMFPNYTEKFKFSQTEYVGEPSQEQLIRYEEEVKNYESNLEQRNKDKAQIQDEIDQKREQQNKEKEEAMLAEAENLFFSEDEEESPVNTPVTDENEESEENKKDTKDNNDSSEDEVDEDFFFDENIK
ncbi:conjugal transfer protein [Staphylococcus aureus]|uniref:VirD4-like conjugal transfer protein, CD1115 family n=1 Tax=Staphylococcus aureus TaxID=1280 RepID=UPI000DAA22CB|nr:type IV secretory system conjugative DNA transfer family protein [Staphylococcus aureus]MBZ5278386.1 type IV secretory system conjugative DNA transfer family protein [Staphylococcus aureus]PZK94948.1 conjugal transfer protein [Staphylococcus aureus]HCT3180790.1 type IV secretory system conjugative DNA transfer family protein [Staphylococcus aureus]